ncbi:Rab11 [Hexamita inflata]|uniref:Rab11 n=1 Tax=Hexamita inflata TaxID=28002 RepID=A0AA86QY85_9EUKA|nr:Rab11 [Hexamita inflata]
MTVQSKVVMLGDVSVGKTAIIMRYVANKFQNELNSTIGASYQQKAVQNKLGNIVMLQIWDTAGQERYKGLASLYYRSCNAVILVWDVTRFDTLEKAKQWIHLLYQETDLIPNIILVANKIDLYDGSLDEIDNLQNDFCQEFNILKAIKVSASSGVGIRDIFQTIADKVEIVEEENQKVIDIDEPNSFHWKCC